MLTIYKYEYFIFGFQQACQLGKGKNSFSHHLVYLFSNLAHWACQFKVFFKKFAHSSKCCLDVIGQRKVCAPADST